MPLPAVRVKQPTVLVSPHAPSQVTATPELYARVSSHDQKPDLDRQVTRLTRWSARAGGPMVPVEAEVGPGMNGARPKLRRLLSDPAVTVVIVKHRDRLGRVNTELVDASLMAHGRRLVVVDSGEVAPELVPETVEVLTRLCARPYDRRSARHCELKAVGSAQRDVGPRPRSGAFAVGERISLGRAGETLGVSGGDICRGTGRRYVTADLVALWTEHPPGWLPTARSASRSCGPTVSSAGGRVVLRVRGDAADPAAHCSHARRPERG